MIFADMVNYLSNLRAISRPISWQRHI